MPEFSTQPLIADLSRALSASDYADAALRAHDVFNTLNVEIIAEKSLTLACREGCFLCCASLRVDAFAHEVLLIAHHLQTHLAGEALSELIARLEVHFETVIPLTPFEHAIRNIPCPLLRDGRCSVYEVRPQSCRRHHSLDLSACEYAFDHPTDLAAPAAHERELFLYLTEAMLQNIEAYGEFGFDSTIYELGSALHEALTDPACWQRWMNREQTFLKASVTPAE